ncbi:MAG: hypothetical protein JXR52_04360 [Bacteroidales bacterium]|nr:hypothetical protein [Bacteroidales bacterium]
MRKIILILIFTATALMPLKAQMHLFIEEQSVTLEDGVFTGWVFPVPGSLESSFKDFRDFGRERSDIRIKKEEDRFYMAEKVFIPSISSKRGDMIAYGIPSSMHNDMAVIFRLGYDISLNSTEWGTEMVNLRNYTREFMSFLYNNFYADSIAMVEKTLQDLEKDLKGHERDLKRMERKVRKNRERIHAETDEIKTEQLEGTVSVLETDIENVTYLIPAVQSEVDRLSSTLDRLRDETVEVQRVIGAL